MAVIKVGVVVFHDIIPFHLSVPCAVFEHALDAQGRPAYQLMVCATEPGPLRTNAGFSIIAERTLSALEQVDMVIIPSWNDPALMPSAELVAALHRAHARGARLVGLCMGAFVLAASGLLDGRPATTHWNWMSAFLQRYPSISVDHNVLYIDDGDIITSAGTAASIDCCLHLVRQQCGAEVANTVARQLVVPPHRQGGQAQFIEQPVYNTAGGDRFMQALSWATENLQQPLTVGLIADKALMSRRSFTRHFQQTTGTTVTHWLLNQRLAMAQRFLEKTDQPVEQVAQAAGFSSALSMRRHFQQQFSTTPSLYRREFRTAGR
ncbi:GlxA family transcriptional regulator [Serratia odorifera]|nr:helix-turn-helix domain-containing protein [Serratia odorifera]MBJ2066847.1 helix-turn-helix domain-containing protein [Serratia odorifera]PNK90944.1 AraC family transcriptional regulator [Serratia odorifera]RII72235.1 AraC family transcriptional regulator [Serratia odorifera]VDZ57485.1 Regulatory protein soxS [Serratia odorifera]HEJ9096122.1 helix-turn-helix domain-containing protein [Serratia odorifera]